MPKRGRPTYTLPDWCSRHDDGLLWCNACLAATENSDRSKLGGFISFGSKAKDARDACTSHAASKIHNSIFQSQTSQPSIIGMGRQQQQRITSRRVQFFTKLLDIVFHLAFFAEPFTHYLRMKQRDERSGVFAGFEDLMSSSTATYNSATFYMEALMVIATIVWRNSRERLKAARFIGIMCDEATDVSIKAKLLSFYRFASDTGELVLQYAGCDDLHLEKVPMSSLLFL